MLLTGTYTRSIDEKLRVAIPKPLREQIWPNQQPGALYIAPGTDGSLSLYTEDSFQQLAEKLAAASPTGREVRDFSRLFYAQAQRSEVDRQGRIRIPPELAQLIELGGEAVMLGVRDHLELWNRARWDAYLGSKQGDYDEIAEKALRPNV
jgi:MraZ protein